MFIEQFVIDPQWYLLVVVLIVFSICVHEYAHAQVALWQGDATAAKAGHLSLNPLRQMGWQSLLMCLLAGIAWGAVPVNPKRMRHPYSDALVAGAGPIANFMLVFGFCLVWAVSERVAHGARVVEIIGYVALNGAVLNVVLGLFNLLPVPILDGWKVFGFFFPALHRVKHQHQTVVFVVVAVLLISTSAFSYFYLVGGVLANLIYVVFSAVLHVV